MQGNEIKDLRESLVETRLEFAARLEVTEKTVFNWEVKGTEPRPKAQRMLAAIKKEMMLNL
jgi:DNA-binding transcriptional regulator YiaG